MAGEPSTKARAWVLFDRVVAEAAPDGVHTNPWRRTRDGLEHAPDYPVLERLLGVALALRAPTTTGVPALALDVWVAYELRRAGFDPDAVWPRATPPRILPTPVRRLVASLPAPQRARVQEQLAAGTSFGGATSGSAKVLGKNYVKQVDVVVADWDTGPELLVSTKRMDSSFGKNAANRVEESYGDAKNLRLRHPLAALGFVYGLRSTVLTEQPRTAEWLADLLQKLGREDDAYDAVSMLVIEYDDQLAPEARTDDPGDDEDPLVTAGLARASDEEAQAVLVPEEADLLADLPAVRVLREEVPPALDAGRFLATMVEHVLDATPVTHHRQARERRDTQRLYGIRD